jgi:hypothetical protein
MSARINGITNTNNDVNIENNMKVLPLVREEYYLTLEAFNKLEFSKDISFVGNDVSFNANISVNGNIIPLSNTSQLGSNNRYWNNAYINNLHINNFVNTINASYLTNNTITSDKIANNTITSAKIANNTITSGKIANNTIVDNNISSNAQILFSKIDASNAIMDTDISSNASIAFSKINTTNVIMDTDISSNASIAFSKINTTNVIMDSDISSNASIAFNKINTTNAIMDSDISSNASIAFSKINTTNAIMDLDISSNASIAFSKINTTNVIMDTDISANASIAFSKINTTNAIMDSDISSNADISGSKIANTSITSNKINSNGTWSFLNIDVSFGNITDISVTNISISGNLIPLNNIRSDLGSSSNYWHHAYIDNIDVSSHIRIGQGHFGGKILPTSTEHELIIDPHGFDFPYTGNDASGRVVILGDLIVRGDTTTINSASIDISDLILNIASNATRNNVFGIESGIELGSDKYASLLYNRVNNSWKTNIGLEISGAITLSGNLVSLSNSSQLGSSNNYWSNAYIQDISVANISVAENFILNICGTTTNVNTRLSTIDSSFGIVNTRLSTIDSSFGIVNTRLSTIDSSLGIVNTRLSTIDSSFGIVNTRLSTIDSSFGIVNTRLGNIDTSFTTLLTLRDLSVNNNMSISGNLVPLAINNNSTLGSTTNYWQNAYINDISARNMSISGSISVSGNIVPLNSNNNSNLGLSTIRWNNLFVRNIDISGDISNVRDICNVRQIIPRPTSDISTSLGTSSNIWQRAFISDLSGITRINGATWPLTSGGGGGTSDFSGLDINTNLVPRTPLSIDIGSSSKYWRNAYIDTISAKNINISGNLIPLGYDFSWQLMGSEIDGEAQDDRSGTSVSLNDDGNIVAIGARFNDGNGSNSGHTRVYKYNSYDASWIRLGQDIDGDGSSVGSGRAVSLNSSGNNVAILSSSSTSIYKYNDISWVLMGAPITSAGGNSAVSLNSIGDIVAICNTFTNSNRGDIRVYKFNDISWVPLGQTLIGEEQFILFGFSISLNAAGNIVATGTRDGGYVKIYSYNDISWVPMGQKLIEEAVSDRFGFSVSLNDAGNIIAIGAPNNDGNGTDTGHVRVYKYDTSDFLWKPLGIDIDGLASELGFGLSVSLNSIGNIVAIGGSLKPHGYTKVYYYNDLTWEPIGVTISGEATGDTTNQGILSLATYSGHSVSLNSTGNIVAIGAPQNDSNGYIDDGFGNNGFNIGSVRIYNLTSKTNSNIGSSANYWKNAYINDINTITISVSGNIVPLNSNNSSNLGLSTLRWNNLFVRNIDVSGDISNIRQIIPQIANDISTSLGTSSNIWQRAFISDLSGITRINGATWPLTSGGGGGTSDFSGLDINTNLIPRNPLSIDLGSQSKYWRNAYIQDISVNNNISISGNILSTNNNSQVPVSYNTFSVVSAQTRGSLPSYIGTTSANVWLPASAYDISKVVLSNRSFIKIEVKVNYTASPEADQTLSFRVLESFNRGISFETNPVFSDISLGSSMGVTINNIYNGSYYEDLSGVTLSGNIITYRLEFRRDCPVDNTIKTPYGIQQSTGNYMSLQELYRPP